MSQYENYNKDDIISLVKKEDVKFIRLQFVDIQGTLKNVAISVDQLENALEGNIMFDGSAIEGFVRSSEADMYLKPDLSTFCIFPWRPQQGKVGRLICDIYKADGNPYEGDPRYVLKKVIKEAAELGYKFKIGPDFEFFLFHTDDNGDPTTVTHDKAGYFDLGPIDLGENVRRDMVLTLQNMGFNIKASHHEASPGQHEIDFKEDFALQAAENITTIKLVVKVIAQRHGLHATFMPKPKADINGSGMHCNIHLCNEDVDDLLYDECDENKLSKEGYYLINGLLKHAKGLTALTNPTINSYKRLVAGYEAPVKIGYTTSENSLMIRIPSSKSKNNSIELRTPDPSANPYLVIAAIIKSALDGLENKQVPKEELFDQINFDMNDILNSNYCLPSNLKDALISLNKDEVLRDTLGECFDSFVESKTIEWNEYNSIVHDWELRKYISRY